MRKNQIVFWDHASVAMRSNGSTRQHSPGAGHKARNAKNQQYNRKDTTMNTKPQAVKSKTKSGMAVFDYTSNGEDIEHRVPKGQVHKVRMDGSANGSITAYGDGMAFVHRVGPGTGDAINNCRGGGSVKRSVDGDGDAKTNDALRVVVWTKGDLKKLGGLSPAKMRV